MLGDRVTVKCGVQLWDGLRVADDVFIGPNATFSNDKYPRSKQYQAAGAADARRRGASIGGGAAILPGLRIGARAMVGAGSVVTHDVPPKAIVSGNPARIVGYVDATRSRRPQEAADRDRPMPRDGEVTETSVAGVTLHRLQLAEDLRGTPVGGRVLVADSRLRRSAISSSSTFPGRKCAENTRTARCQQFLVCCAGSVACRRR